MNAPVTFACEECGRLFATWNSISPGRGKLDVLVDGLKLKATHPRERLGHIICDACGHETAVDLGYFGTH